VSISDRSIKSGATVNLGRRRIERDIPADIHFINVGCGNMTLILFQDGRTYLYDCNVTEDNADSVLAHLAWAMGSRTKIEAFICSHRDSDHMRGIEKVHAECPVDEIWDAGVEGTTTDSAEYRQYMSLRREIGSKQIKARTYQEVGDATVRWMNSQDDDLSDANDQSIVMKIEYKGSSVLLASDTSFRPWKELILPHYSDEKLRASILLASHHGSLSFFDDPSDEQNYYTAHMNKIKPEMTLISVGPNVHDLPDEKALQLYSVYSSGSKQGHKVFTTQDQGNMMLTLRPAGGWSLQINQ
jgi:beta-lactamase superfamily II metal-dependent hydrolase